jgi:hypothetical protein
MSKKLPFFGKITEGDVFEEFRIKQFVQSKSRSSSMNLA